MISRLLQGVFVLVCLFLLHDFRCHAQSARVHIVPGENLVINGTLDFFQEGNILRIRGYISGLKPGSHGFHIHELGDLGNNCKNAGGHFNPFQRNHGDLSSVERHVGDLGNIGADESGFALVDIIDWQPSLDVTKDTNVLGRAIVVHSGADNLGIPGDLESLKTGRAGSRSGCGLINSIDEDKEGFLIRQDKPVEHRIAQKAGVIIVAGSSPNVAGRLELRETLDGIHITGIVSGLSPGNHGFHIHQEGKLGNQCKDAAGHFNPFGVNHGSPSANEKHVGDLGNIIADQDGNAFIDYYDTRSSLVDVSEAYVVGRSFVVHAGEDNLGRPGDSESLKTGRAGARAGCGIIELVSLPENAKSELNPNGVSIEATVEIVPGNSPSIAGTIEMEETAEGMWFSGTISGLTPGLHGFHIHQRGELGNVCKDAGGHFNPFQVTHGAQDDAVRHVGDLGNVFADETGTAFFRFRDQRPTFHKESPAYVGNLAIVIHAGEDNLGIPGDAESLKTGRAGARSGCGIIKVRTHKIFHSAFVDIVPGSNTNIKGSIEITRVGNDIRITGQVTGLTPGLHGFHIHQNGRLGNQCKDAGGHFNPGGVTHGAPSDSVRHVGDLGNILADENGVSKIFIEDSQPSMDSKSADFIGDLAIVIHAGEDNLGVPGDEESLKTGRAGARSGCGLIRMLELPNIVYDVAVVNVVPGSNPNITGTIKILRTKSGILLRGQVSGLSPGLHGFHVHQKGVLSNQCKDAGGHFNPFKVTHGGPHDVIGHVGDLGNILARSDGNADVLIENSRPSMDEISPAFIGNLAIVIHSGEDNLGVPGDAESLKTGRAGSRSGCGLIKMVTPHPEPIYEKAFVRFVPGSNPDLRGGVEIHRTSSGIQIKGYIGGLTPGFHGFHIHQRGNLGNQCKDAGGHFNPFGDTHGGPLSDIRHVGDLGNILVKPDGDAFIDIEDARPSMDENSIAYIGNLAIVIHAGKDNFGLPGDEESLKTGRAGARSGCGIIQMETPATKLRNGQARVRIVPGVNQDISGLLILDDTPHGLFITGDITGLSPGKHGFHIHEKGDLGEFCKSAGGHFNPLRSNHGPPDAPTVNKRHLGDLGNILADTNGVAVVDVLEDSITLDPFSDAFIGELAVVIHAGEDNLGVPGDAESLKTGRAGARSGCGIISTTKDPQFSSATVRIIPGSNPNIKGNLNLSQTRDGIKISGRLTGLTPGLHGFHIHEIGELGNQCKDAAGHFNPLGSIHGSPSVPTRHVGDFGNIDADVTGSATIEIFHNFPATLNTESPSYVGGRAIVIHGGEDNLGVPGDRESLTTGRAGARSGCGLIQVLDNRPLDKGYYNEALVEIFGGATPDTYGRFKLKSSPDSAVHIEGDVNHLPPFSTHGFHIHEKGQLGNQCKDAGGHFNPYGVNHGGPLSTIRHVGDLGNIETDEHGVALLNFSDPFVSLNPSKKEFVGDLAFVVHAGEDNLGVPGDAESFKTGKAGARAGCGLIKFPQATVNFIPDVSTPGMEGFIRIWKLDWGILMKTELTGLDPGVYQISAYNIDSPGYECGEDLSKYKAGFDFGFIFINPLTSFGSYKEENNIERDMSLDPASQFYIGNMTFVLRTLETKPNTFSEPPVACGLVQLHTDEPLKDDLIKKEKQRIFFPNESRSKRTIPYPYM